MYCIKLTVTCYSTCISLLFCWFWLLPLSGNRKGAKTFTPLYIALYTILIVSKQLYSVKQENSLSIMQEDNNGVIFQLKSIQWWSSSALFQKCLCNQSPTKQARGDSGKETKTPSVTEMEKKPWEKPVSIVDPVLWPDENLNLNFFSHVLRI